MNQTASTEKSLGMTYEQLMNSHFIKYPTNPKILHTIFNPFLTTLITMLIVTTYIKIVDGDWGFTIIAGFVCSAYICLKMLMVTMNMDGHGVGMIRKGKLSVLGFPTVTSIMLILLLGIILAINFFAYAYDGPLEEGFKRVKILGVCMLFGFIMSMLSWRFHTYYTTWYGSEYSARIEFENKGYDKETIELKIKKLKKLGILL